MFIIHFLKNFVEFVFLSSKFSYFLFDRFRIYFLFIFVNSTTHFSQTDQLNDWETSPLAITGIFREGNALLTLYFTLIFLVLLMFFEIELVENNPDMN